MQKTILMEKYPVNSIELQKSEISQQNVDEIIDYFKSKVDSHPVSTFISIFNHFEHTKSRNGEINEDILDAKNIVFCFGAALPNTKILAARPRSIGVAELEDKFTIDFIDAPKESLTEVMATWCKELKTA